MLSIRNPPWERFQDRKAAEIFRSGGKILDIGGGLRISTNKSNRFDKNRYGKYGQFLADPAVQFLVSDLTGKFNPDILLDIHKMDLESESVDAIFCLAVLEHIEFPHKAVSEILRVLKKGGRALCYVPFLYRYHADEGNYADYFRYTVDGIKALFKDCELLEIEPVRGYAETIVKLSPFQRFNTLLYLARFGDLYWGPFKRRSRLQASGYLLHVVK